MSDLNFALPSALWPLDIASIWPLRPCQRALQVRHFILVLLIAESFRLKKTLKCLQYKARVELASCVHAILPLDDIILTATLLFLISNCVSQWSYLPIVIIPSRLARSQTHYAIGWRNAKSPVFHLVLLLLRLIIQQLTQTLLQIAGAMDFTRRSQHGREPIMVYLRLV